MLLPSVLKVQFSQGGQLKLSKQLYNVFSVSKWSLLKSDKITLWRCRQAYLCFGDRKPVLQSQDVEKMWTITRQGKSKTKDVIELHYGRCRMQSFWSLTQTWNSVAGYLGLCCIDFDHSQVPQLNESANRCCVENVFSDFSVWCVQWLYGSYHFSVRITAEIFRVSPGRDSECCTRLFTWGVTGIAVSRMEKGSLRDEVQTPAPFCVHAPSPDQRRESHQPAGGTR